MFTVCPVSDVDVWIFIETGKHHIKQTWCFGIGLFLEKDDLKQSERQSFIPGLSGFCFVLNPSFEFQCVSSQIWSYVFSDSNLFTDSEEAPAETSRVAQWFFPIANWYKPFPLNWSKTPEQRRIPNKTECCSGTPQGTCRLLVSLERKHCEVSSLTVRITASATGNELLTSEHDEFMIEYLQTALLAGNHSRRPRCSYLLVFCGKRHERN